MKNQQELAFKGSGFQMVDLLLIITVVIWGSNPTVVKLGLREISPFAYNLARYAIATISCWVFLFFLEKNWKIERQDIIPILFIGFIGNFINQVCFIVGVSNTTAGNSSLLMAALPIVVVTISGLCRIENISKIALIGIGISFSGILFVVAGTGQKISLTDQYFYGNIIIFLGVVSWAIYTILNRKYLMKYSPIKLTAYGLSTGLIIMLAVWIKPVLEQDWTQVSLSSYMGLLYSGVCSITIGTILWNTGIKKVGSTRTSLYNNITPVVSVILGIILLGESFKLAQGFGAGLIFLGLTITRMSNSSGVNQDLDREAIPVRKYD